MSAWRLQWRTNMRRTVAGVATFVPDDIKSEDGHDLVSLNGRLADLLKATPPPCWVWIEDLDSKHKGNSIEKPKAKRGGKS